MQMGSHRYDVYGMHTDHIVVVIRRIIVEIMGMCGVYKRSFEVI